MATLLTEGEFSATQYADLAENVSANLSDVLDQAEDAIQGFLDRKIARATYVETHAQRQEYIFPRQYPIAAVTQVRTRTAPTEAWTVLDPTQFLIPNDDLPIVQYFGGSLDGAQVEITYDAGYDPVPPVLKRAMVLQTVLFLYQDYEVYGVGDGKPPGIRYMQEDINQMIAPYRRIKRAF